MLLYLSENFLGILTLHETLSNMKLRAVADTNIAGSKHGLNCFSCREQLLIFDFLLIFDS